ncbi:MAG: site-2 protease family protein [Sedimentisphaerales bacterium]|nr:site-2 protease family protein [Sedimentisphaerales bacterium]
MFDIDPVAFLITLAVVLPSLTIHEFAHAWTAYKFGDDTAKSMGRLTLNPIAHIDPIGTILVPLIAHVGWAKPVPVNFSVLTRWQMLLVAVAGPISNILMAIFLAIVYHIYNILPLPIIAPVKFFILIGIFMNLVFAVFNLLPIPPLDGSRIVYAGLKSPKAVQIYRYVSQFGIFIIIGLIYIGGFDLIVEPVIGFFFYLLRLPSLF